MDMNINSETINKTIDLVSDSSKKTREALDSNTSKGIYKVIELLKSTPLAIKADVYIAERPYKMQKAMEEMKRKYENVPVINRVEPSSYIALKSVQELSYCLDEDYLKNMFTNILISDMDNRKKSKVLPSYIEIIRQLSKDDAELLTLLKSSTTYNSGLYLIKLKTQFETGFHWGDSYLLTNFRTQNEQFILEKALKLSNIVIDNLLRLGLIVIPEDEHFSYDNLYESLFEYAKQSQFTSENIKYSKKVLRVTDLGKNFIDICLS